jgi:lipoyl-dependent peroxiredoxin
MPTRTAQTHWTGSLQEGSGQVELTSSGVGTYDVSFPKRAAEEAGGTTSPEELIAAAHAGCFAMALGSILAGWGTPPERLDVSVRVTMETSGTPKIKSSDLEVRGVVPRSDQAAFDEAAHEAERNCLVSRALQGNVEIRVHAALDERPASSAA